MPLPTTSPPRVAIVLPPREAFAPHGAGAVALLVRRLAAYPGRFARLVVGLPVAEPFADVAFRPARPALRLGRQAIRYAAGIARVLCCERPDLIEVHNRPDVALFLADRFPGTPVSLFLHNDPQGMRRAGTPADRARLLARLPCVVTVSDYLRGRLLEGVGRSGEAATVLPNCIDLEEIPPAPPVRERAILFVGRVVTDKGADSFVAACAQALPGLPGWRADIIGADRFGPQSPDTGFLRALRPAARAAGANLHGYRPHAEVLAAMSRAAIVVVPSRWNEPFGMTALEAMACGAALISSPRGGLAEVTAGAAVIIDPDDPAAIAAAITTLARDPQQRASLAEIGLARARAYDVAQVARALDALRTDVLAAWSPPPWRPI